MVVAVFEGLVREDFSCEKTLEQRLGRNEAVPRSNNAGRSLLGEQLPLVVKE